MGVRWEPYFGQNVDNGAITTRPRTSGRGSRRSDRHAPAGSSIRRPGLSGRQERDEQAVAEHVARAGIAWDVAATADRDSLVVRSELRLPSAQFLYIAASASPSATASSSMAAVRGSVSKLAGGDTHPLPRDPPSTRSSRARRLRVIDPDINSTRVQSWNVTSSGRWAPPGRAPRAYLGSYADRMWDSRISTRRTHGAGTVHDPGVSYPSCTVSANTDRRRTLY